MAQKLPTRLGERAKKYKVVWQVLQALRAHDDRFDATINQLDLNRSALTISRSSAWARRSEGQKGKSEGDSKPRSADSGGFRLPQYRRMEDAIYAKMVMKVGQARVL